MKATPLFTLVLFFCIQATFSLTAQNELPSKINPKSYKNEISSGFKMGINRFHLQSFDLDYRRQLTKSIALRATISNYHGILIDKDHYRFSWSIGIEKQFNLTDKLQFYTGVDIGQSTHFTSSTFTNTDIFSPADQIRFTQGLKYQFTPRFNMRLEYQLGRSYLSKTNAEIYQTGNKKNSHAVSLGFGYKF